MGIITIEQNDSLFWLGRYTERVYTTVKLYANHYDTMIDEIAESYQKFCIDMNIPDIYGSKDNFIKNLCSKLQLENVHVVLRQNTGGGLALFWKNGTDLHIQDSSPSHIDAVRSG